MSWMRLCAASRPVSILPTAAGCRPASSWPPLRRQRVQVDRRLASGPVHVGPQVQVWAVQGRAGAVEHQVGVARRRRSWGIIATGLLAARASGGGDLHVEHGGQAAQALRADAQSVDLLTVRCAALPACCSGRARSGRTCRSAPSATSLASSTAFSAVPPTPMPSMPGGHQPAPMVGTVLSTQSTTVVAGVDHDELDSCSRCRRPLAAT